MAKNELSTFGDSRALILETIIALKKGEIRPEVGVAIAANMKTLNDSIQVEINAAKMSIKAREIGKDFGEIMRLGQRGVIKDELLIEQAQ